MNFRAFHGFLLIVLFPAFATAQTVFWKLDNLANIGGHAVTVVGAPKVVETDSGKAVEFNGSTDGLFLDVNPLAGLQRFTVEIEFQPAAAGPEEQRFVHSRRPRRKIAPLSNCARCRMSRGALTVIFATNPLR